MVHFSQPQPWLLWQAWPSAQPSPAPQHTLGGRARRGLSCASLVWGGTLSWGDKGHLLWSSAELSQLRAGSLCSRLPRTQCWLLCPLPQHFLSHWLHDWTVELGVPRSPASRSARSC